MAKPINFVITLPPEVLADDMPSLEIDASVGSPMVGDRVHFTGCDKSLVVENRTWLVSQQATTLTGRIQK